MPPKKLPKPIKPEPAPAPAPEPASPPPVRVLVVKQCQYDTIRGGRVDTTPPHLLPMNEYGDLTNETEWNRLCHEICATYDFRWWLDSVNIHEPNSCNAAVQGWNLMGPQFDFGRIYLVHFVRNGDYPERESTESINAQIREKAIKQAGIAQTQQRRDF